MKLRPYQTNLINDTRKSFARGNKRVMVVLPCGGGKTVCFAYMANEHVKRGGYVHFYVHRRELISQTQKTFEDMGIPTDNIYIGMVQSRKKDLKEPSLIIFDECHHSAASTWRQIIEKYHDKYIVGLTATPIRSDGTGFDGLYDDLVIGPTAEWLIENNYLAPYDYYAPKLSTINPKDFKMRGKDFDNKQVTDIMLKSKIYGDIKKYIDLSRKTIIYCPSIEFSKSLEANIKGVVHFDGDTPITIRDDIVKRFKSGEIRVLSNVDLIGEGFDVPDCDCVILLRPTASTGLYIQQSMRAMRYAENKRAVIYDLVGNCFTHGLPTDNHNWSLRGKVRYKIGSADEIKIRQCGNCLRVYGGKNRICPYCNHDNGKTKEEIKIDEAVELEKIKKIEKREVGMARNYDELVAIGIKRGYNNPEYWARQVLRGREYARRRI